MRKYLQMFEIHPSGWLMLSVLFFFADLDEFLIVICCVLVHETGHLLALRLFKISVRRITLNFTGVIIWYHEFCLFGFREAVVAMAGPLLGLCFGIVCSYVGNLFDWELFYLMAGCNTILSLFNLLPAKPLDGWRCIHALWPNAAYVLSVCTAITVAMVGVWLMYEGYGTALAIMGIILLRQEPFEYDGRIRKRSTYRKDAY
ncbi:MAG: hypothetical protein IJD81_01795 [Oscillospiraceae bacterium]|nr:hypothetical protein [Oscillospiraceae bacterium]